jgi:hypothetical protein
VTATPQTYVDDDGGRWFIAGELLDKLVNANVIWLDDDVEHDENDEPTEEPVYRVNEEVQQGHNAISPEGLKLLVDTETLLERPVSDLNAIERLRVVNYMLSAPEWSVSYLEDICHIIRAGNFLIEIPGAQWASH